MDLNNYVKIFNKLFKMCDYSNYVLIIIIIIGNA